MLNMDFSQRVVIQTAHEDWVASPRAGVWRKPLAREEAEQGHATSIVRYDPGSSFSSHGHPSGEEILVLQGTFSDQTGDYHAGTYMRNPQGFVHAPFSKQGCILLVKLHQFMPQDDRHLCIDTHAANWQQGAGNLETLALHHFGDESVAMVRLPAGEGMERHQHLTGEEVYVISGELIDEDGSYPAGSWIRNPRNSQHQPHAIEETLIWIKTGHL